MNINDFSMKNEKTIEYIINSEMIFNVDNYYSPRQKKLVNSLYVSIKNKKYKSVMKNLFFRRVANYIRKCYRALISLVKTIIGRP